MLDLGITSASIRSADIDGVVLHPGLEHLLHYWKVIGGNKRWPSRSDIDPVEIPTLLGNLHLVDVQQNPLRFRYRLTGTNIAWRLGLDGRGKGPESIPDPMIRKRAIETFSRVALNGRPRARQFDRAIDGVMVRCDCLTLPLSSDQQRVDMLLIGQFHQP